MSFASLLGSHDADFRLLDSIRSRDYMVAFRKLAGDFITHAKDSWVYASVWISSLFERTSIHMK